MTSKDFSRTVVRLNRGEQVLSDGVSTRGAPAGGGPVVSAGASIGSRGGFYRRGRMSLCVYSSPVFDKHDRV